MLSASDEAVSTAFQFLSTRTADGMQPPPYPLLERYLLYEIPNIIYNAHYQAFDIAVITASHVYLNVACKRSVLHTLIDIEFSC